MSRGKKAKRRDDLLDHPRLKQREIKEWREKLIHEQFGVCPLCGLELKKEDAVLDHCHKTGLVRASLHSGCNSMLGKIENAYVRMGKMFGNEHLLGMIPSVWHYVNTDYSANPYHPSHRTEEEKRLDRNEKARKKAAHKRAAQRMRPRGS